MTRCWHLERAFPNLQAAGYRKTSDRDDEYNCVAWAAFDVDNWWWPDPNRSNSYWPWWSERRPTRENFVRAFHGLGYFVCTSSRLEPWFEKVALYELAGIPEHMARQLEDGSWTSKCGDGEDITHFTLDALESSGPWQTMRIAEYGSVTVYMKRLKMIGRLVRFVQQRFATNYP